MLAKFKDCGVHMLDSADDIMPAALHYLGLDPNSTSAADLEQAADLDGQDQAVRAQIPFLGISQRAGRAAKSASWSAGRATSSRRRTAPREAKNGIEIGYAIPKEGAQMWFDNLAIPKDAPHVAEAHAFIDYPARPARRRQEQRIWSPTPTAIWRARNSSTRQCWTIPRIYPDAATMAKLYTISARDPKTQRLINRLWTRVKTGQ